MPQTQYTFWLLPAEPLRSRLREVVSTLAKEFKAPVFEPHVTFYHGPSNPEEAREIAADIAANISPLELDAQELGQSEHYTRTLFIQFKKSSAARKLFEAALDTVADPAPYMFNPHLSLLYHHLNEAQRKELCRRPLVPMGKYRFDAICAVEFEAPWSDKSAREYQILVEYGLREGFRKRKDDMR